VCPNPSLAPGEHRSRVSVINSPLCVPISISHPALLTLTPYTLAVTRLHLPVCLFETQFA
jgi:hypothetical protein